MTVPVDVVEELGSEVNLIFRVDAPPANTELVHAADEAEEDPAQRPLRRGREPVHLHGPRGRPYAGRGRAASATLTVDMEGAHFFDPESGAVIGVRRPAPHGA